MTFSVVGIGIVSLFYCVSLSCPRPYAIYFMTRYILFVLKVPLNTSQLTKHYFQAIISHRPIINGREDFSQCRLRHVEFLKIKHEQLNR